ncbi:MAG: elongation factor P [Planctomycetota bacterium]|nr:elongation factor P [Planctomycetota bacterium]
MIANELRAGTTIIHNDGNLYQILEFYHTKPGKGGAFVRVKMRCLKDGKIIEYTFRSEEKVERAFIERKEMEYLYRDGEMFVFMNPSSYEQVEIERAKMESVLPYLVENETYYVSFLKGTEVLSVEPPESVVLEVVETDPGEKGDTATGGSKPAKLSTGLVIKVPLFVKVGDKVKIDTRSGTYIERA